MASDVYTLTIDGPGKNSLSNGGDAGRDPPGARGRRPARARHRRRRRVLRRVEPEEVATLDVAGMERFLGVLDDMIDALFDHPGPMVACVNGHAIAGGCVIALCAEIRVIADDPKIRWG
jgi:enoyl-CoA hydratase/carnithine racemase